MLEPEFTKCNPPRPSDVMFTMATPEIAPEDRWPIPPDPWYTEVERFVDESLVSKPSASQAFADALDAEEHSFTL